ncbi:hypothetical protein EGW08_019453 [Elysia chlorotica]|uniref:C2H2-type domain-containing protein n=1 Tax=Elysia chlorotica TaxID=188477 RepID=A0A3S1B1M7_ELYCH|nr:hypothetical protein EGW08_019453 [Elysia chlorotica]
METQESCLEEPNIFKPTPPLAEIPKLTESDRLELFGGDEELLSYYLGLRDAAAKMRQSGVECHCDPRDEKMVARLKVEGWQPRVLVKDLRCDGDNSDLGFVNKQTALDEGAKKVDSDLDSGSDSEIGERGQSKLESEKENTIESFVCGVQGCSAQFTSLASHESHYHTSHNFVCHVCRRVFVSNFLLDIHLEENHDSYFQVLSPKIDMYRCLVESCALKFRTAELRKDHLVTVHKFPAPFSFHGPINHKSPKPKSSKKKAGANANRNRNSSSSMDSSESTLPDATLTLPSSSELNTVPISANSPSEPVPTSPAAMDVEDLSADVSTKDSGSSQDKGRHSNRGKKPAQRSRGRGGRMPATICFGRGSQRAFQHRGRGRHWHQTQAMDAETTVDIEKVDFSDLVESLDG